MTAKHKIIAASLIVAAALAHLVNSGYHDWDAGGNSAYVILLLVLFVTGERGEDERLRELKLKAIMVAFGVAYVAAFVSRLWFKSIPGFPRTISAYDFMFIMLVTALSMLYYWRWQDGRGEKDLAPR